MKAKCLESTEWYSLTFEAGVEYDIDDMLCVRLIRSGKFEEVKGKKEVEQPETLKVIEPVATSEPLPETDDLAITEIPEVIAEHVNDDLAQKPTIKPKGKKNKRGKK